MDNAMRPDISVRWLVSRPSLKLSVIAGVTAPALDRPITFAHSIDLAEPAPWLRGGELLLTTGLPLPADSDGQKAYLRSVVEAGVSAVGFGVGLSHQQVPTALIEEADRVGIPLLQIPLSTPFIAIVRTITARLAEIHYQGVVHASRVLPRMTSAALRHGSEAVIRELAAALGGDVVVLDESHGVTLSSAANSDAHTAVADLCWADLLTDLDLDRAESSVYIDPDRVVTVHTIRVGRRIHGYLVLATSHGLDPADHLLVGQAVSLIALEHEKPVRVREDLAHVNTVILEMLLDGSLAGRRAVERLELAGFPSRGGFSVLVLRGGASAHLVAAVDDVLLPLRIPRVCVDRGSELVVVLPATPVTLAAELTRRAAVRSAPAAVYAGVATTRPDDLLEAVLRATTAADSATSRRQQLVDAASMAGHVLITDPASRAVLAQLADMLLGPLIEHDRIQGTSLLPTLRAFLDHNGHNESAATALGIHRHTLRSRLDRIRDILAVDIDSAHVRAELLLALTTRSS